MWDITNRELDELVEQAKKTNFIMLISPETLLRLISDLRMWRNCILRPDTSHLLQWTTETPTEAGWYWYQAFDWNTDVAVMAFVLGNIVLVHSPGLEYVQHSKDNIKGRWAGPIPRPKDRN